MKSTRRGRGRRRRVRSRRVVAVLARDLVAVDLLVPARLAVVRSVDHGIDERPRRGGARLVAQPLHPLDHRVGIDGLLLQRVAIHLLELVRRHVEEMSGHLALGAAGEQEGGPDGGGRPEGLEGTHAELLPANIARIAARPKSPSPPAGGGGNPAARMTLRGGRPRETLVRRSRSSCYIAAPSGTNFGSKGAPA